MASKGLMTIASNAFYTTVFLYKNFKAIYKYYIREESYNRLVADLVINI